MQICYCEDCGLRIPTKDLEDGSAFQLAENQFRCVDCIKKKGGAPATPSTNASGSGVRRTPRIAADAPTNLVRSATPIQGTPNVAAPAPRHTTTIENTRGTRVSRRAENKPVPITLVAGAALVVGIVILAVVSSSGKSDSADAPKTTTSNQASLVKPPEKTTTPEPVKPNPAPAKLPETPPVAVTKSEPSTKEEPPAKAEPLGILTNQTGTVDFREGYAQRLWADLKREVESPDAGLSVAIRVRNFAATYASTAAGKEAAELIQTAALFKEPAATTLFAHFTRDFKTESPVQGWAYLVNPNGPIGNAANYQPLVWNKSGRFCGSATAFPAQPPYGAVSITSDAVHPGYAAGEFRRDPVRCDRFAIVAYTLQPDQGGSIHFWAKVHRTAGDNESVELLIYVKDTQKAQIISKELEHRGPLGNLNAGDTVYFAIGPNKSSASDTTIVDFKLFKAE